MSARPRSASLPAGGPAPQAAADGGSLYVRFLNGVLAPLWAAHERSPYLNIAARLEREGHLSLDERRARQLARLKETLRHAAATTRFYAESFRKVGFEAGDLRTLDDLARLPILSKQEIRDHRDDLVSSVKDAGTLHPRKTSGSTGVSLNFFVDDDCQQWKRGVELYRNRWSGWRLGEYRAMVWGNPPDQESFRGRLRNDLLERAFFLDTLRMNDAMMESFVQEIFLRRPTLLFGHAHSLYLLARYWRDRGLDTFRFKGIISTAMVLHDYERAEIESVFDSRIFDRYGCEEVSLIASECEAHTGLHVNTDSLIVEVVPDADGFGPDGEGRVVVTDLYNRGMPFIRYAVGDMAVPADGACPCGRSYPRFQRVAGRIADYLLTPDGDRVSGISLTENFATLIPGVKQVQIVQERLDHLRVRTVAAPDYGDETLQAMTRLVTERFGSTMTFDLELVERIDPEPSGKYRFAICRVEPPARR